MSGSKYPWFVRSDLDGFFGLFVDNLVQLILIVEICYLWGMSPTHPLLTGYILPGGRDQYPHRQHLLRHPGPAVDAERAAH